MDGQPMDDARADEASIARFALSPQERALVGVKYDGDQLTIGLSGGRLVTLIGTTGLGIALSATLVWAGIYSPATSNLGSAPSVVIGSTMLLYLLLNAWSRMRQRVACSPSDIEVRSGFFRNDRVGWSDVVGFRICANRKPAGLVLFPRYAYFGQLHFWHYDSPTLRTRQSSLALDALISFAADDSGAVDGVSGAAQRVQMLRRYQASVDIDADALGVGHGDVPD